MKLKTGFESIYRKNILFFLFLILAFSVFGQDFEENKAEDKPKKKLSDKVFFGGTFGLQFGSITIIEAQPLIGYKFHPKVHAGVSVVYSYMKYNQYDLSSYYYGPKVFTNVYVYQNVFLQAEMEMLNVERYDSYGSLGERMWLPGAKAGIGYQQMISGRVGVCMSLLWNFIATSDTPYTNPEFKIGMVF